MVTTYSTKHKKPQNYAKNESFIKLPILTKNDTKSNPDRQSIKEKCRNLANFGISWMMQGSNLRPAD